MTRRATAVDEDDVEQYGFRWGQLVVQRWMTHVNRRGTARLLGILTDHHELQVHVSPTGRSVRVWLDHVELKPEVTK